MKQSAFDLAKSWATNPYFDAEDRKEIQKLLDQNDEKEILERFYKDLEFGTGGIRSIIGMGQNRINKYTIRKATAALAQVILKSGKPNKKVAISYDSRKFSLEFAKETACVMAGHGIQSLIFDRLNPVPLLSFSVRYHGAIAGVMITASHNPPEYNGYKVFWEDGAQVTPPVDKNVIDAYYAIQDFEKIAWIPFAEGEKKGLIQWVGSLVEDAYFEKIKSKLLNKDLCRKRGGELKIVYTPIHGTGLVPCTRILDEMGFKSVQVVEEQRKPDSAFPTVKSPNPENPEALALAVKLLQKSGADLVLGTDPDCDRLGVALEKDSEIVYLNGNQIGILLLYYILENLKQKKAFPPRPYFVKTIVTSDLQEVMAKAYGVEVENTLTGFKWICGRMTEIEKTEPERNFIFGTEESFGYLNHDFIRDKDGVSSVAIMSEATLWYKTKGLDLIDALDMIYEKFGFSHETLLCLDYFGKEGAEKIQRIMENFRAFKQDSFLNDKITGTDDYQTRLKKDKKSGGETPINLPKSNVLGFNLASGNRVLCRPSGTEPKIKFYIMVRETAGTLDKKKKAAMEKTDRILGFIKDFCHKA